MKRSMAWLVVVMIFIIAVGLGGYGCAAKFINKSAATIGASASVYDIGMQTVRDLQDAGYISDEQREEINRVATIFRNALIVADDALVAYNVALAEYNEENNDANDAQLAVARAALKAALKFLETSWEDLAALVNSIAPGTLPGSL